MSEYDVGYGKPPKKSRFKKGQSGNAAGRPKGRKNLLTALQDELQEPVLVNENGRQRKITKVEAIAKQLANRSAAGDLKAIERVSKLVISLEEKQIGDANSNVIDQHTDQALLKNLVQRLKDE